MEEGEDEIGTIQAPLVGGCRLALAFGKVEREREDLGEEQEVGSRKE